MTSRDLGRGDRSRVVVPEFLPEKHLDLLRERVEVVYDPDLYGDRPRLLAALTDTIAILIRNRTVVDEELLAAAPSLRVIGRLGVGLDNIDVDAASQAGVEVFPAHGANAVSVAEYVMGVMLFLQRGVYSMTSSMIEGRWPRQGHAFGRELNEKTLGLVGFGVIAREVANRALGFNMMVEAYDPYLVGDHEAWSNGVTKVELTDLLARSDVVSIHVPLREETHHMIDAEAFSLMRPDAILINTARDGIIDEDALASALRNGEIAGAALDVFDTEPLRAEAAAKYTGLDNLVLTPHLAGNAAEAVDRVAGKTVETVLDALGLNRL